MKNEYKRSKTILTLGITGLFFLIAGTVLIVLYTLPASDLPTIVHGFRFNLSSDGVFVLSAGIVSFVIFGISHLFSSILILTRKYSNIEIEKMRIMMGILTLIMIGPIGAIVFSTIALKKLKSGSSIIYDNTSEDNGLEPIIK